MSSTDATPDPFGDIADQFMDEYRQGHAPQIEDYAARYPECAGRIHELLPVLMVMEQVVRCDSSSSGQQVDRDDSESMVGREVGDYRIIREIGRGGMGVVYEAEQISLGRRVALKLLPTSAQVDSKLGARFDHEARAAARLHHTNIVPVYAVGQAEGLSYYAMQFINGLSLDNVLEDLKQIARREALRSTTNTESKQSGKSTRSTRVRESFSAEGEPGNSQRRKDGSGGEETRDLGLELLTEPTARSSTSPSSSRWRPETSTSTLSSTYWRNVARIGVQVAEGLHYAHEQGVIHRDVKPSNLVLDVHNIVWITDFGLAKSKDNDPLTFAGDILGTLRYMPPEAFSGVHDARSDVYSLGITLYELLTLQPAFCSTDRRELIRLVTHTRPKDLKQLRPRIHSDLATIVHKAIEAEPADRYATAQRLADDLRRYLADEPIHARRTPSLERLRRWSRQNKGLAAALAGIACLLVLIVLGSASAAMYFHRQQGQTSRLAERNLRLLQKNRAALRDVTDTAARLDVAHQAAVQQREATQRNLYYSHMANANQAVDGHRGLGRARAILDQWRPRDIEADLRDWEWYFINARCHQEDFSLDGLSGAIRSISRSPDGRSIASVSLAGSLTVWDVDSRQMVKRIEGVFAESYTVAWSPDGKQLAVGTNVGLVVWNCQTWEIVHRDQDNRRILAVTWSPDGGLLATIGNEAATAPALIRLLETSGWHENANMTAPHVGLYRVSAAFNHPGDLFGYPSGNDIILWDVSANKQVRRLVGHDWTVQAVQFHPQRDDRLASGGRDATAFVWNTATGEIISQLIGHTHAVSAVNWHPQGSELATSSWDGTVRIWDLKRVRTVHTYQSHQTHVFSLAWNDAGNQLASAGDDGLIKFWDVDGPSSKTTIPTPENLVIEVDFHPEGTQLVAATSGGRIYLVDTKKKTVLWHPQHGNTTVRAVFFRSPADELISIARGGGISRWDIATRTRLANVVSQVVNLRTADLSYDGQRLAIGGGNGRIEIWKADLTARVGTIQTTIPLIRCLRFSPDGKVLAVTGQRAEVQLHDLMEGGLRVIPIEVEQVWTVAWNSTGTRLASSSDDQVIRVWNAESSRKSLSSWVILILFRRLPGVLATDEFCQPMHGVQ